jgi:hypothetical protein
MSDEEVEKAPHIWSKDALLAKAQRYAETMIEHDRDDWRFGLASTFVLEFVARATLAAKSPVLLADVKDWNNIYFSLGFEPKAPRFLPKSADISTVISRIKDIVPNFTDELAGFVLRHMNNRNGELHSGQVVFDSLHSSDWLPVFYVTCQTLLEEMGSDLERLFGRDEAAVASTLISAAKDEAAKAIQKTIQAHKVVWEGKKDEERKLLSEQAVNWAKRQEGHRVSCPACGSVALLTGAPMAPPKRTLEEDLIIEKQSFLPARFECIACGLKISGYSHLNACSLGDPFSATFTYDPADYYAPEPEEYYEPDYNE